MVLWESRHYGGRRCVFQFRIHQGCGIHIILRLIVKKRIKWRIADIFDIFMLF